MASVALACVIVGAVGLIGWLARKTSDDTRERARRARAAEAERRRRQAVLIAALGLERVGDALVWRAGELELSYRDPDLVGAGPRPAGYPSLTTRIAASSGRLLAWRRSPDDEHWAQHAGTLPLVELGERAWDAAFETRAEDRAWALALLEHDTRAALLRSDVQGVDLDGGILTLYLSGGDLVAARDALLQVAASVTRAAASAGVYR